MLQREENIKYDSKNSKDRFNIVFKEFLFSDAKNKGSIFECCKILLNKINSNSYIYNTDGLIFTSKLLGVTQEYPSDQIKNKKYTWKHSFKWKPPQYNTIDFLIEVKKDKTNVPQVLQKTVDGKIVDYYEIYLNVGYNSAQHGFPNAQQLILNEELNNDINTANHNQHNSYKATPFYPTNPSDQNAYICHIPLKMNKNGVLAMYTEENEIFEDDTIVEFSYSNKGNDKFMYWKPLRCRHDKTFGYKNSKSNFGNDYRVANSNWQSIHNPITEKLLSDSNMTLSMSDLLVNDKDVYYNRNKEKSQTVALRNFHNLYVKRMLINIVASKCDEKPNLLDLAVGKGGDLQKWMASNVNAVLGIDISPDNIHNSKDGACARYIQMTQDHKKTPKCMFIVGDTGKLLSNGNFTNIDNRDSNKLIIERKSANQSMDDDSHDSNISRVVFESLTMNPSTNQNNQNEKYKFAFLENNKGLFSDKFDITSMQFAIHYMFESNERLHTFLKNVSDYTKDISLVHAMTEKWCSID